METKKLNLKKIKRIELTKDKKISKYKNLSKEFIKKIFGINSFLISDESLLSDFMNVFDRSEKEELRIRRKIKRSYNIDIMAINKPWNLWKIFKRIEESKSKEDIEIRLN